jgi:hypothetical protein
MGAVLDFRMGKRGRWGRLPKCLMLYIDPARWGHVAEWLRNGLQNRVHQFNSGRGLQSFQILRARPEVHCHPIATGRAANPFLIRTPDLCKGGLHNLGGARVGIREHVAVDVQGDRRGGVADAPADRQDV